MAHEPSGDGDIADELLKTEAAGIAEGAARGDRVTGAVDHGAASRARGAKVFIDERDTGGAEGDIIERRGGRGVDRGVGRGESQIHIWRERGQRERGAYLRPCTGRPRGIGGAKRGERIAVALDFKPDGKRDSAGGDEGVRAADRGTRVPLEGPTGFHGEQGAARAAEICFAQHHAREGVGRRAGA